MINRLTRKLEAFGPLPEADKRLLDEISRDARAVGPKIDLIREGDTPSDVNLILEGFACRYKMLPDGTRQIMAYLVPGDFCDLHVFILKAMDHSIATLSACKVVKIPRSRILELMDRPSHGRSGGRLWWMRRRCASGWSTLGPEPLSSASGIFCASCCCGLRRSD